jgi:WD40 repeat protein
MKPILTPLWQGLLQDYTTCLAWSPETLLLAAASAAGEVSLWRGLDDQITVLQGVTGQSIDALAFSFDGQFLAASGQDGRVLIWQQGEDCWPLYQTLDNAPNWVDHLAWSPTANHLVFSLGRYAQVWDAEAQDILTTLPFESSSVQGFSWRHDGTALAIGGYQGVKIWEARDWDADPKSLEIPTASQAIAWSPDGQFLASGNQDQTLVLWDWSNLEDPWIMRGFPGKVHSIRWCSLPSRNGMPLLAVASAEAIALWEKQPAPAAKPKAKGTSKGTGKRKVAQPITQKVEAASDTASGAASEDKPGSGWQPWLLELHNGKVQDISFRPRSRLLASAAADGWVYLWAEAEDAEQILDHAQEGYSCVDWHRSGRYLATGGQAGELEVWKTI